MNFVLKRLTVPCVIAGCLAGGSATALAATQSVSAAEIRYRNTVNRTLFDRFGHGGSGRNLYCAGPAIVRFQILPNGRTAHVTLVRRSLPGLDARLTATITTMVFPRFAPGMPARPYTMVYKYGIWPLARKSLEMRTNCR